MKKEEMIFKKLKEKNYLISVAESVTGGKIVDELINTLGISEYLKEAYIVYSNESKNKILNVSRETIEKYSVVSEEVIAEMLNGLQKISKASVCVATSGYAEDGKISFWGVKINSTSFIFGKKYFGDRNIIRNSIKEDVFDFLINNL